MPIVEQLATTNPNRLALCCGRVIVAGMEHETMRKIRTNQVDQFITNNMRQLRHNRCLLVDGEYLIILGV